MVLHECHTVLHLQIWMNAQLTMEVVLKHVPTLLAHSLVAVTLGTHLTMMECLAMVNNCMIYTNQFRYLFFLSDKAL